MNLGDRIYEFRRKAAISQESLASRLNVTRQSISLWETNQSMPSLENLIALAQVFDVSLDELIKGESAESEKAKLAENEDNSNANLLASGTVEVNKQAYKKFCEILYKSKLTYYFCLAIVALVVSVIIFATTPNIWISVVPLLALVLFVGLLIRIKLKINEKAKLEFEGVVSKKIKYNLFDDRIEIDSSSEASHSFSTKRYQEITSVVVDNRFFYVIFGNIVLPIDKLQLGDKLLLVASLLNCKNWEYKNPKIQFWLTVLFFVSLFSIFIALIIVSISSMKSPIPQFSMNVMERMWQFWLIIPIPLASAILGGVFLSKGYKCKKNIVAGIIMSFILLLFGSFSSMFKHQISHDFDYVDNLESEIMMELPDSGYVAISYNATKGEDLKIVSEAMIKFDQPQKLLLSISASEDWISCKNSDKFNLMNMIRFIFASDYDYFCVYDATDKVFVGANRVVDHEFYALAYDEDTNIFYVCNFRYI